MNEAFRLIVDRRGRVTFPRRLREKLGLPNGGRIEWFRNDSGEIAFRAQKKEDA